MSQKVLVVGNRPSGFDIIRHILPLTGQPVYQSKRSEYGYEPATAPEGVIWKPQILRYEVDPNTNTGRVVFNDGTVEDGFDKIIYTTGYRYSLPFLQRQYPDISTGTRIVGTYLHTFYRGNPGDPPLCFVGSVSSSYHYPNHKTDQTQIIDGVSFRGFEFQAIASARYLAGKFKLPSHEEMKAWEYARFSERGDNRVFHSVGMYSAKEFWVKLVELCGNPGPGEKGRPFPEQDERFWKMFEEIYHWRVRDCLNPLL